MVNSYSNVSGTSVSRVCNLVPILYKSQDRKLSDVEQSRVCRNRDGLLYQQIRWIICAVGLTVVIWLILFSLRNWCRCVNLNEKRKKERGGKKRKSCPTNSMFLSIFILFFLFLILDSVWSIWYWSKNTEFVHSKEGLVSGSHSCGF